MRLGRNPTQNYKTGGIEYNYRSFEIPHLTLLNDLSEK